MSNNYTFENLTTSPIPYSEGKSVSVEKIIIPRIQRPYAQGRRGEAETRIRTQFINAIFEHLIKKEVMDLHFLYGAVKQDSPTNIWQLELLDGQQRFTTLFLLHWYLLNRERSIVNETRIRTIKNALLAFAYETRSTSTEFCKSFVNYSYAFDATSLKPSEAIKKARWYYNRFDNDSTIMGMLVMLDFIHDKYNELSKSELINNTDCLQFYLLPLVDYEMSEDLYVKMNARGLSLTPFDNFKADYTGAMKKTTNLDSEVKTPDNIAVSHRESIGIKLDTKWIDLFWTLERKDYDVAYMLFFSRFFAYRYIVDFDIPATSMTDRKLPINTFFTQAEDKNSRGEYFGFEQYQKVLESHSEYFEQIEALLDTISEKAILQSIHEAMKPVWEMEQPGNFLINAEAHFSQSHLVEFGAICDFILKFKPFDAELFKCWMRIVHNVIENTNIDSLIAATGPLRNLHTLIRQINTFSSMETVEKRKKAFFESVAKAKPSSGSSWPGAIAEEQEKARRIAEDDKWLKEFIDAETHPYLKGAVRFFYDTQMTLEEFKHNRDLVKEMFDANGIASPYKEEHILIRAIMSHLKTWNKEGLANRYVTEKTDKDKRLKLLLLDNEDIRKMFVSCLKTSNSDDEVKSELSKFINNNTYKTYKGLTGWDLQIAIAHNALCTDVKLYNWMATQPSPVSVSYYKGHIAVAIPRVWYDRFLIDSERDSMAIVQMTNLFMNYVSDEHTTWSDYTEFNRFKGEEIVLQKQLKDGSSFRIAFQKDHVVRVYVECTSETECKSLKNALQIPTKADKNRLYIDVDGNLEPQFNYFLQGEYLATLTKKAYDLFICVKNYY